MKLYSYVIKRDYGFAPNPYFNYCTLATCKPIIRRTAQIGDWIAAFGSLDMTIHKKLVLLMQVEETLTFDEYWEDCRFKSKRPVFNKGKMHMYGDNIYHHIGDKWMQEPSHHSETDGSINNKNLKHDTKTDRVLVATQFYYFGNNAIDLPTEFDSLICRQRNHIVCKDVEIIGEFINYICKGFDCGIHGLPYSRKSGAFVHYSGES